MKRNSNKKLIFRLFNKFEFIINKHTATPTFGRRPPNRGPRPPRPAPPSRSRPSATEPDAEGRRPAWASTPTPTAPWE